MRAVSVQWDGLNPDWKSSQIYFFSKKEYNCEDTTFLVSLTEKGDSRLVCSQLDLWGQGVFFNERLNNSQFKVLEKYPNDNDKLMIAKIGYMTSGSTSFSSLEGIRSNIHVVGLADLTSLYNYFSPIEENEWNCSSGDLQCTIWCDTVADGWMVTIWSLIVSILEVK